MIKRCLDEGTLQAYFDGELSVDMARGAAAHLAECASCSEALANAGNETALLASAFAPDANLSVPTAELRARINAALANTNAPASQSSDRSGWNFNALLASLSGLFTLTPQRAVAFASLAVLVIFASILLFNSSEKSVNKEIASGHGKNNTGQIVATPSPTNPAPAPTSEPSNYSAPANLDRPRGSGGKTRKKLKGATTPFTPVPSKGPVPREFLPGEGDYQSTIASLDRFIKSGESILKPQEIAEYERNIAVLDKAIEETRRVAIKNPKDKDAMNFLLSAYQSKIELMSTVADSAQVAAMDR